LRSLIDIDPAASIKSRGFSLLDAMLGPGRAQLVQDRERALSSPRQSRLDAKTAYSSNANLSIEIDAANCVFDSNPSNNSEAPYTGQEGGITTWFGAGHQTPTSTARIKLVGSDVEKNNSLVDYYNGDTFFDIRFSGGGFRPPFFPSTTYALGPPPVAEVLTSPSVTETQSAARSWSRDNN